MRTSTRIANGVLGLLLLAFAIFEAVSHGGLAIAMALTGMIAPDLAFLIGVGAHPEHGMLPRRVVPFYNATHLWPLPILAMALNFTLGLAWLAHICLDRSLGYGLRARSGAQRSAAIKA